MKYTVSNTINAPLEVVSEKFSDPEGMFKWMPGLKKVEHLSGEVGRAGAKSEFYFEHKGREMNMTETILEENLPHQMKFSYQGAMGYNEVEMKFEKINDSSVKQINTSYFELKGIMKVFGFLFKGMFKKQSMKYLDEFKKFAEE